MIGQRLVDGTEWKSTHPPGAYWRGGDGRWYVVTPNGLFGDVTRHEITEHADGTITVSPSILVRQPNVGEFHGYLERGVWRSC